MLLGRLRPFVGIVLVLLAAAGMYFWETTGRDAVFTTEIVAAARDISAGEILSAELFEVQNVRKENVASGTYAGADIEALLGKEAKCDISEGSQITGKMCQELSEGDEGLAPFVLFPEWIKERSGSLRAGDRVDIYSGDMAHLMGSFKVAFVRDEDEQPVAEEGGGPAPEVFRRGRATGRISSIEIKATPAEYAALQQQAESADFAGLILVQSTK